MNQEPKLVILWHSVSPHVESGYGRVTRNVTTRLVKYGYKVIMLSETLINQGTKAILKELLSYPFFREILNQSMIYTLKKHIPSS